jgi:hypothetical protein
MMWQDADERNTLDSGVFMSSLTRLELGSNHLNSLPKTFQNLTVLQTLNLSRNAFNKLPSQLLNLSSLKTLNVSNNTLSDLPKQLGALRNLQTLDASFNSISSLPLSISVCAGMQTLSLQHNNISELPQAFFLLTNLTVLSVNHNPITIFDEDFAMLNKLRRLLINHTQIKRIPTTVEYMCSLKEVRANAARARARRAHGPSSCPPPVVVDFKRQPPPPLTSPLSDLRERHPQHQQTRRACRHALVAGEAVYAAARRYRFCLIRGSCFAAAGVEPGGDQRRPLEGAASEDIGQEGYVCVT